MLNFYSTFKCNDRLLDSRRFLPMLTFVAHFLKASSKVGQAGLLPRDKRKCHYVDLEKFMSE